MASLHFCCSLMTDFVQMEYFNMATNMPIIIQLIEEAWKYKSAKKHQTTFQFKHYFQMNFL